MLTLFPELPPDHRQAEQSRVPPYPEVMSGAYLLLSPGKLLIVGILPAHASQILVLQPLLISRGR